MVEDQLLEAADVLTRLPDVRVHGYYGLWPKMILQFSDLVGQEPPKLRRPPPSPEAISRMEQTMPWLTWLEPRDAKLVWARADGPLLDAALQLRIQDFELPGLPEEVGKYPYLGQKKLGDDWHRQVVNRPVAVPFHTVGVGQRDGRDKNDRSVLKARMIADHPSEFKTVELRHADIADNDSDVLLEQMLERLPGGLGFDQVFSEALQCRLVAEELRRLIVDKQYVNGILGHDAPSHW